MKRTIIAVIALAAAFAWCPCSSLAPLISPSPDNGSANGGPAGDGIAPDFTLDSLDGTSVTLSDLRGQIVVLDFWASWCTPCEDTMPHLQELYEQYADQGVVVLAINEEETRNQAAQFVEDEEYTFTVLLDSDGGVADRYGVWGIPHTVVVDQEGRAHTIWIGPEGAEEKVLRLLNR